MHDIFSAVLLGIVEGLTEFLPVSSTGHLIITGDLLGFTGPKAATFEVVIQLGAILAVVVLYWDRFWGLLRPKPHVRFAGMRGIVMLGITSLPASLLGLATHHYIKENLFSPATVALALGVGAVAMLLVERRTHRPVYMGLDDMTPTLALGIGLFQCLALWPGFSRSAATIMGGMLLGARRGLAAEYSFIAAVPIMFAATGYDLLKSHALFTMADLPFFATGFVVSFLSAWVAVKVFIGLMGRVTLVPFAWYRLAVAPLVFWFMVN
ncbi:undecaprenyl-diphosphate phosphatase [Nitratidesulfovibrio sp. SRB-5]|uniref:undecaprenyl-diphosphate phosphatase n=1 Tax=Nitratidesulfovibrio sp. SRB-5 TaxID=2872636 RepID=UPI0010261712|nr:undecaprenyl-diphosphate phosphatase [Nitratidesulfovibrio sp. SRB-5]MBZ2171769.1 undecaprenyl-diphosphate phosphatase [Nitratidesulfovibrio sp. SRB-5]RXF78658.1 undecaprenyl-diphosphate phosphatase [Desulfovibrio sp. DS-1]